MFRRWDAGTSSLAIMDMYSNNIRVIDYNDLDDGGEFTVIGPPRRIEWATWISPNRAAAHSAIHALRPWAGRWLLVEDALAGRHPGWTWPLA